MPEPLAKKCDKKIKKKTKLDKLNYIFFLKKRSYLKDHINTVIQLQWEQTEHELLT